MIKDRVFLGFIAGLLAAVAADVANWVLYLMNLTNIRFVDWASIILLGHQVNSIPQIIVMQFSQMVWDGSLGIIFIMLIPKIKLKGLVFKGLIYAFMLNFGFRAIAVLFALEPLKDISFASFLSNVLCSIIWGSLMSYFILKNYNNLDKK